MEVLYVLPYGQMSLWGATVITNLMSAIPWIGQDIVEFLLNLKPINLHGDIVVNWVEISSSCLLLSVLPTIGSINWKNMRGQKPLNDKSQYLKIPFSFLATLAGLIDGDGYIAITHAAKGYVRISLVISLDIADELMLHSIRNTLGFGRIAGPFVSANGSTKIKLIFSRTELQELLFPLLQHHGIFFLTETRRQQFNLAMYIITNQITQINAIPSSGVPVSPLLPLLPSLAAGYLELSFFAY